MRQAIQGDSSAGTAQAVFFRLATLGAILLSMPAPALAYVDLGSGSFMVQVVIGALAGTTLAVKMYWKKIRSLVSRFFTGNPSAGQE